VELELVEELRAVAADDPEERRRAFRGELVRAREVEAPFEPDGVDRDVLEQHRPALGDRVVAEPPFLRGERGVGVGEVLRMARLVEERAPVVRPALRLHHEDDSAGHLDRGAEGARVLVRPLLEVELDALLRAEVDAEIAQGALQRRKHAIGRERGVPLRAAPGSADVEARDLVEPEPDARAEEAVARLLPQPLRLGEEAAALSGKVVERKAEAPVELGLVRGAESLRLALDDLRRLQLERVQMLLRQLVPRRLDPRPCVAVLLVHQPRLEHPVRDLLPVDGCGQRRFELGDPLCLFADEVAEVALAGELPQLAAAGDAFDRDAERERGVELGQALVALVDRRELVRLLLAGEMQVRLLVHLREEAVGVCAERIDLSLLERLRHAGS
jgi:hypothetical protein